MCTSPAGGQKESTSEKSETMHISQLDGVVVFGQCDSSVLEVGHLHVLFRLCFFFGSPITL